MRVLKIALVLSTVVGTAACERQAPAPAPADLSWLDTLELKSTPAEAVVSPVELGMVHAAHVEAPEPEEPEVEPVAAPARTAARSESSSSSARRSSSSSSRRSSGTYSGGSSGGGYEAPAPRARTVEVKNTKRDAAIGAVVGAGVGAVAGGSRNRVKGAVIGAAAGGLAGAVIGSTIDKSKRTVYDY